MKRPNSKSKTSKSKTKSKCFKRTFVMILTHFSRRTAGENQGQRGGKEEFPFLTSQI